MVDCGRKPLLLSWYFRVFFLNSEVRDGGWSKPGDMWQLLTLSMGCKHQKSSTVRSVPPWPVQTDKIWSLSRTLFSNLGPSKQAVRVLRPVLGLPLCTLPGVVAGM